MVVSCPPPPTSAHYLIRGLCEDWIVVVDVHYAHVNGQLRYPGRAAVVLGSDGEIQPLHLLKVHRAVGHDLTCAGQTLLSLSRSGEVGTIGVGWSDSEDARVANFSGIFPSVLRIAMFFTTRT